MSGFSSEPLAFQALSPEESLSRTKNFVARLKKRRTVRDFSSEPVSREIIETALLAAGSAPSGANQQPWTFVAISDPALKARIRAGAEAEEKAFYDGRAGKEWLEALAPLGTDWEKPFLETAPWLIAIFMQRWGKGENDRRVKHYYALESVGIATGFLIAALHEAGLATLTHTPSPMGFLNEICGRPDNEKAIVLLVAGKPAPDCRVPAIGRKPLDEIARFL
ncbi:MAG: nitroreductase family protein [Rhodoblastus sp.]